MAKNAIALMKSRAQFLPLLLFQAVLIVLYAVFVRYAPENNGLDEKKMVTGSLYAMFQDVQVMIFIGFGFLMTFLRRYGYSALGFTALVAGLLVQWAVICQGFYQATDYIIHITMNTILGADIAVAAPLISMGALLGRTSVSQLLIMGVIEIAVFSLNEYIIAHIFQITDCGGSITVHVFGAYFGLAVSAALGSRKRSDVGVAGADSGPADDLNGASYSSDITAMIGTLFLWVFWPSFNGALLTDDTEQYRAIVNTYLSLAAATVTAFVISSMVHPSKKFDMVHVQNSTLAGGVAAGTVCNLLLQPHGALLLGAASAIVSVLGYHYLTPWLESRFGLRDTCGVHNLHGMPALMSGALAAGLAAQAGLKEYGRSLYEIFPAMTPEQFYINNPMGSRPGPLGGYGRSAAGQACYQLLAIVVTLATSIVSGAITGCLISVPLLEQVSSHDCYDDESRWHIPHDSAEAHGHGQSVGPELQPELGPSSNSAAPTVKLGENNVIDLQDLETR